MAYELDYLGPIVSDLAHCFFFIFLDFSYEKLTILLRIYVNYIRVVISTLY